MHRKVFILNTGRTLKQGESMEGEGKYSSEYFRSVAIIYINPVDADELGIDEKCKVYNENGVIVLKAVKSDDVPRGMVFIPMGPWANILVDHKTESTGMPNLKSSIVYLERTDEDITSLLDILKNYGISHFNLKPEDRRIKGGKKKIIENHICSFCGELCDFLKIEMDGEYIVKTIGACPIGRLKLINYYRHRILKPRIKKNGRFIEVSIDEAIDKAVRILVNSMHPLLFGWSSTSNEALEIGMHIAEILGGIIDNTTVICHGQTTLAAQEVGTARATLGLIRNLSDVIILWGSNATEAHPNHFIRWILSKGTDIKGRRERKLIVIDVRRSETAKKADLFIKVEPGRDYELITALRMAVKDLELEADNVAGVPIDKIYELADIMRSAKYGVIFEGMGVTMTGAKYRNVQELIKLAHDLNEWTRFVLIPMRGHYNVTGGNEVMLWISGYPYAIDYMRGFPKMIPGVTTSTDALLNRDVDAALIIASDPVAHFPRKAVEYLSEIPVIVIDPKWSLTALIADVVIPSGITGIECSGTAYRMDSVPLYLKKIVDPPPGVLCDTEILKLILKKIIKVKKGGIEYGDIN